MYLEKIQKNSGFENSEIENCQIDLIRYLYPIAHEIYLSEMFVPYQLADRQWYYRTVSAPYPLTAAYKGVVHYMIS